ncbi:hypothetical protein JCM9957A_60600 [Kineosporia succinea]
MAGAAFGAALLLRPREVIRAVGADPELPGLVVAARVLGARHVVQAVGLTVKPGLVSTPASLIDGLHATSMVALAAISPSYRRVALVSAGVAGALGAGSRPRP